MGSPDQADRIEGLADLASAFGVSVQTVKRRLNSGQWPEVIKTDGTYGETWSLDRTLVQTIADRENWVIDLRTEQDQTRSADLESVLEALLDGQRERNDQMERAAAAEAKVVVTEAERDRQAAVAKQALSDLEHERSEVGRLQVDLEHERNATREVAKQLAVAQAEASERQTAIESRQSQIEELQQRLDAERERTEAAVAEASHLQSSMGWWSRRRAEKQTR